ncbi:MAG: hypothetical protein FWF82_04510 [Oscillospiraceae bacterium]|nr:hypothetical protein [Oscillospiraceae bacterium]
MNNINEEKNSGRKTAGLLDLRTLFKNEKAVKAIIFGAFLLIILVFVSDLASGTGKSPKSGTVMSQEVDFEVYEKQIEQKLRTAISAIDGVGDLTVAVTLDSLCETVYSDKGTNVRTVITPKVRGVAIVCDGGGNPVVKQKVIELVSRMLGIGSTKISVTN